MLQLHLGGRVALYRPNPEAGVGQAETLLVAAGNHCADGIDSSPAATGGCACYQRAEAGPAYAVQLQPNGLRLVAQCIAEEFTDVTQRVAIRALPASGEKRYGSRLQAPGALSRALQLAA